jgi:multidrug efflux system outer membrane protein
MGVSLKPHLRLMPKLTLMALCTTLLVACSSTSELDQNIRDIPVPSNWQQNTQTLTVQNNWLAGLANQQQSKLGELVQKALTFNHQLRQQAYNVEIKKQQLIASGSALSPSLDLSLTNSRRKSTAISTASSIGLDFSYELDIWGKLSANERQSNLNYLAEQSKFDQASQQLVADVVTTWFSVIEAQQLLQLFERRVANSRQNLEIIEAGYRQGLNNALDVYLTRNELNNELARVALQGDTRNKVTRQLERLVGDYPKAALVVNADLPLLENEIPLGLPSELISRKPALMASWYQLLAKDAGLAFAHKKRFPSLSLRADISKNSSEIQDLLSGSLGWSLIRSLSAPIFDAGRLKANEEQARLLLKQGEQRYLDSLYSAFNDVENAVSTESALKQRYQAMIKAQENAVAAQTLSFEQYQNGLVSYTTVLDAQSRAFGAQSTVIQIKNQLIANRVKLHVALGGDFAKSAPRQKAL